MLLPDLAGASLRRGNKHIQQWRGSGSRLRSPSVLSPVRRNCIYRSHINIRCDVDFQLHTCIMVQSPEAPLGRLQAESASVLSPVRRDSASARFGGLMLTPPVSARSVSDDRFAMPLQA